jgi:anti-sigma-K factor RskA
MIDFNDDPEMIAAEYVLGVLPPEDVAAIRMRLAEDANLASAVAGWEKSLAHLASEVTPIEPPHQVWEQISASLEADRKLVDFPPREPGTLARLGSSLAFWRMATAASLAFAAGLAVWLYANPGHSTGQAGQVGPYMTALTPEQSNGPAWLVQAGADGKIVVTTIGPAAKPADKDLQLWAVARGDTKPVSLGLLPQSGTYVTGDAGLPHANLLLLVSIEPKGGSRTGRPTGPVLIGGELTQGD